MYAPARTTLLTAALAALVLTSPALAANIDWDDNVNSPDKSWSNSLNWSPNGSPAGDDLEIGNHVNANGDTTIIDQDFTINSLSISNGADADTSGNTLTVTGDINVSGIGSSFIAREHSSGPETTAVSFYDATISANGAFVMDGGRVIVNEPGAPVGLFTINANAVLTGHGVLRFSEVIGIETNVLTNDGTIQSRRPIGANDTDRFTLTIEDAPSVFEFARIDLDGVFDIGVVNIQEQTTLNVQIESQVFQSTMDFEAGSILELSDRLLTDGATININAGFGAPGVDSVATVRGNAIGGTNLQTNATQFNINSGSFVHEEGFGLNDDSSVNLAPNTSLVIGNLGNTSGTVSGIRGQINFNGAGTELVVDSLVFVSTPSWDWDGPENATSTINSGGTLQIDSNDISPSAIDDSFDGTININGIGRLNPDIPGGWIFSGNMNLDSNATVTPSVESTETMTVDGGLIHSIGGFNVLEVPVVFTSDSSGGTSVDAGSTIRFSRNVTFDGGSTHTGTGQLDFSDSIFTVNGSQTFNMTGGTVDLSGNATEGETWFLNAHLLVNADTLREFGNNTSADTDTIVINHSINSSAKLTVNLDTPADEWTLGPDGLINILGTAALNISIAGSDLNVEGDIVITDTSLFSARIDVESGGQITVNTPGRELRLVGGSAVDPNRINGGTITGAGELSSNGTASLVGHGTIDTDIDFDGAADLLATGGTLTVTGNILDADRLGTQNATGTLTLTQFLNTANITALELNGGTVNVTATDLFNNGLVRGHGTVNSVFFRNNGLIEATGDQTLTIDTANPINLDGTTGPGNVEAVLGDVIIVNSLTDHFGGTITVGAGRFIEFQSGWTLGTNGTLDLNGGPLAGAMLDGDGATLRGTVDVDQKGEILGDTTFASSVTVNLPVVGDVLELKAESIVESGAVFVGGGSVVAGGSSTLVLADGADVDVIVVNQGVLQIGASPGSATVAVFQQFSTGTLEIEIDGAGPGDYDILFVDQLNATLDGDLDVTLTGGFTPSSGDTFPILQVLLGTRIGTFDTVAADLPALPGGLTWLIDYNPSTGEGVTLKVLAANLPGDFNADGIVDAADYTTWRDNLGAADESALNGNGSGTGGVDQADYTLWKTNFGLTAGASIAPASAVPEPASLQMLVAATCLCLAWMTRRTSTCK